MNNMYFIVHFDRSRLRLLELETFEDGDEAFERLSAIEMDFLAPALMSF